MQRTVFVFLFLLITTFTFAQIIDRNNRNVLNQYENDSLKNDKEQKIILSGKTSYKDYKIIAHDYSITYVDTTLSMQKDYKFNFIRKDNFELLPFHNQGQTFNNLAYTFNRASLFPEMGARAKHFNFYSTEDIKYYSVATPTTELMYRTGLEQGQVLDALFTFNTSKKLNFSIAYKGLRSLGKYRNALSSHGNLRITSNYQSKKSNYNLRAHIVAQDLKNQEFGGLTDESVVNFNTANSNFNDRARLETNYTDASNYLQGNRYYVENDYNIWQKKDSAQNIKSFFKVGATLNYQQKKYKYGQNIPFANYGNAFYASINDNLTNETFNTQAFAALKSPYVLGEVKFKTNFYKYLHRYGNITFINSQWIPSNIKGNIISIGGEWKTKLKKFNIDADISSIISGNISGNYLKAIASYKQDSLFTFKGGILIQTKSPNFNFLLNQSNYAAYNWRKDFKNINTRSLLFNLQSKKILNAEAQITQLDNYTFFDVDTNNNQVKPSQTSGTINYLKIKASKDFMLGKFGFANTLMYQKVATGSAVFRVPEFVSRNTIYFADHLFKGDPLYLQTGVTLNYFTSYYANAYNPIISEFYLQNNQKIGGYPVFDFFINAQIQRARLFFKLEHFNSGFNQTNNYYTAPLYPYRDFVIRFGLVWNFFI